MNETLEMVLRLELAAVLGGGWGDNRAEKESRMVDFPRGVRGVFFSVEKISPISHISV